MMKETGRLQIMKERIGFIQIRQPQDLKIINLDHQASQRCLALLTFLLQKSSTRCFLISIQRIKWQLPHKMLKTSKFAVNRPTSKLSSKKIISSLQRKNNRCRWQWSVKSNYLRRHQPKLIRKNPIRTSKIYQKMLPPINTIRSLISSIREPASASWPSTTSKLSSPTSASGLTNVEKPI